MRNFEQAARAFIEANGGLPFDGVEITGLRGRSHGRAFWSKVRAMFRKQNLSLILCGLLSLVVLHTCLQVEFWDYRAGGVIPVPEGARLHPRIAGFDEDSWRKPEIEKRKLDGKYDEAEALASGRPLTPEEQAKFREDVAFNTLVDWTRGMGTLQYVLAPTAAIWAFVLVFTSKTRRARVLAALFTLTNAVSVFFMLYRGYFND